MQRIARVFLAFLLVVTLGACGRKKAEPTPTLEAVPESKAIEAAGEVTFVSVQLGEEFAGHVSEWIADLQKKAPNVQVTARFMEPDELHTQLTGEALPGDVLLIPAEYLAALDVDGRIDSSIAAEIVEAIGEAKFYKQPLLQAQDGAGRQLGIPYYSAVQGVWYRKDLLQAAGVEPPATVDALIEAAQALNKPPDIYGIYVPAPEEIEAAYHAFEHLALGMGVSAFDSSGNPDLASQGMAAAFSAYASLRSSGAGAGVTLAQARDMLLDGKLAMLIDSTALPYQMGQRRTDVKVQEVAREIGFVSALGAAGREGQPYAYTLALAVRTGADKDAARAWLDYLMDHAYNVYWIPDGWAPALRGYASQWRALKAHDWFGYYEQGWPEDLMDGMRKGARWGLDSAEGMKQTSRLYASQLIPQALQRVLEEGSTPEDVSSWLAEQFTRLP